MIGFADTPLSEATVIAEKLRCAIERYDWAGPYPGLTVTLSIGLCSDTSLHGYENTLAAADDKLYRAKCEGKNRVVS